MILTLPLVLEVVEDFHETGELVLDPLWTAAAALGLAACVVLRRAKKQRRRA